MTKIKGQIYVPNKDNPVSEEDYDLILPQTTIDMVEGKATKEDAEAGTDDIKFMSPLRVLDAIKKYMITFLATAVFTGIVKAVAPDADSNDNSVPTTSWVKTLMNTAVKTYIVEDYLMAQTGYIKFGAWLGHLILQWGYVKSTKVTFPIQFSIIYTVLGNAHGSNNSNNDHYFLGSFSTTEASFYYSNMNFTGLSWIAIGSA